jgi:hypothetical protein
LRLGGSGEAHATVQHLSGMDDDVTSLEFLRKVYRNNDLPLSVRMRAAALAIPFEAPKLAATAYIAKTISQRCTKRCEPALLLKGLITEKSRRRIPWSVVLPWKTA